jgi:serine/threonine protein kinase
MTTSTVVYEEIFDRVRLIRMQSTAMSKWLPHDAQPMLNADIQLVDPADKHVYTLQRTIGDSKTATIYAGYEGNQDEDEMEGRPTTIVIKNFKKRATETLKQTEERAEREMRLTQFIDEIGRRQSNEACGRFMLCPVTLFTSTELQSVVSVFRFARALDLQTFLVDRLYPSFSETTKKDYQYEVLNIAVFLCEAVHGLNSVGIIHGDISPRNIIVSWETLEGNMVPHVSSLRLINVDESHSCLALPPILEAIMRQKGLEPLSCMAVKLQVDKHGSKPTVHPTQYREKSTTKNYSPTATYRDPRAATLPLMTVQVASAFLRTWSLFEMYSCAIVMQLLIDPEQLKTPEPTLRKTPRSINGMLTVQREMTGKLEERTDLQAQANTLHMLANMLLSNQYLNME